MRAPVQDVCRGLGLDLRGQTSASFNMRQNYERCLFKFEDYLSSGAYIADLNAGAPFSSHSCRYILCNGCVSMPAFFQLAKLAFFP